ncbi:MAG TPA: RagB/SusD family nutrient uptake outer membrane protein, partial [Longimicrobiales bacterium]|nr:RagB/SusD family nutrient uptake outer membrane protein [Longimicrobiales bacterium]
RGTYHFSRYYMTRWPTLQPNHQSSAQTGLNPMLPIAEMDLLKAEAYIRLNQPALAADLINKTRVAIGELPPITETGVPAGADCVPRWDGVTCGSLMQALMYEKRLQNAATAAGVAYFDARGWGTLLPGTQVHFPVPARELEILGLPFYRFGGVGNEK